MKFIIPTPSKKGRDLIMFKGRRNQGNGGKAAKNVGEVEDAVRGKQL